MCLTRLIKISPWRQIQINGYCYYHGDLETRGKSQFSEEMKKWSWDKPQNLTYQRESSVMMYYVPQPKGLPNISYSMNVGSW